MNLDDAQVADEYGPDRFMPREVDEGAEAVPPSLALSAAADLIRTTIDAHGREVHGPDFEGLWPSESLKVAEALARAGLLATRLHDAEVAAKALEAAADVERDERQTYPAPNHDPLRVGSRRAERRLRDRAARIRAEAQR